MLVKCFALLQRAEDLRVLAEAGVATTSSFWHEFWAIDHVLVQFSGSLPIIPSILIEDAGCGPVMSSPTVRELTLAYVHVQTYSAAIRLHQVFAPEKTISYERCIAGLNNIMRIVRLVEDVDPRHLHALEVSPPRYHAKLCEISINPLFICYSLAGWIHDGSHLREE